MTNLDQMAQHHSEYIHVITKGELFNLPSGATVARYCPATKYCSGLYRWNRNDTPGDSIIGYRTLALKLQGSEGFLPRTVPFRWKPHDRILTDADLLDFGIRVSTFATHLNESHLAVLNPETLKGLVGVASIDHLKLAEFDAFTMELSIS